MSDLAAASADCSATACLNPRQRIAIGDLVIVYEDFKTLHAVRVAPPARFDSRHGSFPHADFVGRRFGERVSEPRGRGGFVYLLSPSPELWTATLPHRTQILYIADISMIVLQLELQPGSVCIEAGTGSGSLSHALARAVGARGHLHTFEFNAHRAQLAAAEFAANGLGGHVTSLHGDVCADGWEYANTAPGSVDAAIFDLPQPWDAPAPADEDWDMDEEDRVAALPDAPGALPAAMLQMLSGVQRTVNEDGELAELPPPEPARLALAFSKETLVALRAERLARRAAAPPTDSGCLGDPPSMPPASATARSYRSGSESPPDSARACADSTRMFSRTSFLPVKAEQPPAKAQKSHRTSSKSPPDSAASNKAGKSSPGSALKSNRDANVEKVKKKKVKVEKSCLSMRKSQLSSRQEICV